MIFVNYKLINDSQKGIKSIGNYFVYVRIFKSLLWQVVEKHRIKVVFVRVIYRKWAAKKVQLL